jgi:hypothetical protein
MRQLSLAATLTAVLIAPLARSEEASPSQRVLTAEDVYPSLEATPADIKIAGLESEDAFLTDSVTGEEFLMPDAVDCGDGVACGSIVCDTPRQTGRWTVLSELTALAPSYSTDDLERANNRIFLGPRLSIGWESPSGFGIRGRGWGFDNSQEDAEMGAPSVSLPVTSHEITFSGSRLDLDFYKRIEHSTGDFAFGASVTAAHLTLREEYTLLSQQFAGLNGYYYPDYSPGYYPGYYLPYDVDYYSPYYNPFARPINDLNSSPWSEDVDVTSTGNNGLLTTSYQSTGLVRNVGGGLGLMFEGTHRFVETPEHIWSLFGRGRVAYLVGRWKEPYGLALEGDANMAIGEAALGVEYRRRFRRADLALQCAFEIQSWDVSIIDRVNLTGVTTGLGVTW